MLVYDRIEVDQSKRTITTEGYLSVPATLARVGIYDYMAGDIGMTDRDAKSPVKVYRPSEEVFNADSMSSFSLKPVTDGHPSVMVDITNIKKYQKGNASSEIMQDGEFVKTDLLITDAEMIKKIDEGKCEVSNGYTADFDFEEGSTESGEVYDAIQRNIRGNHIAIVDRARGGRDCRLSDEQQQEKRMKKIMFDGIEIEVTDQGEQAIGKLRSEVATANAKTKEVKDAAIAKEAELQALFDAEKQKTTDAQANVLDAAQIDALVKERSAIVTDAKRLSPEFVCDGKSNDEIVEGVVCELNDSVDLAGKEDAYKVPYCRAMWDQAIFAKDNEDDGAGKIVIDMDKGDDPDEEAKREEFKKKTEDMYKMKEDK